MNILELNNDEVMALGKCIYDKVGTDTELLNSDTPLMSALDKILKANWFTGDTKECSVCTGTSFRIRDTNKWQCDDCVESKSCEGEI
jgi:hypothetical protein